MKNVTKKQDKKSTSIIGKKRTRLLYMAIISLTVIVLAIVYFLIPNILGDKESVSPKIRQMRKLTAKIGKLETDLKNKEDEFSNLLKDYYQKTGETVPAFSALGLTREQKKILEDKIKNQQDVSIKELLNDILDKNNEISEIEITIKKYEELLPQPHIVIEGENHYQIAMNFLVHKKKVPKGKAIWLVERTALFESLIPRFKVWNFYSGEEYGTFVTQGDAIISPNELTRKVKKLLIDVKDKAISEKDRLESDIKILESKREQLISQVEDLYDERKHLMKLFQKLSEENSKMEKRLKTLNTLSIIIDLKKNLIKRDILKSVFLKPPRLKEIPSKYFNHKIDLRDKDTIEISARQFKLRKIKKITIYPRHHKIGTDYYLEIDTNKKAGTLTILKKEKFKNNRIVISVE